LKDLPILLAKVAHQRLPQGAGHGYNIREAIGGLDGQRPFKNTSYLALLIFTPSGF
jgi:hypothetical protein